MRYVARASIDYAVVVEADSQEEAVEKASHLEFASWDTEEFSPIDVEEIETDECSDSRYRGMSTAVD